MAKVMSLTISLDRWEPTIWRRLWVKDTTRLSKVCQILYTSMGWEGCHLSEIKTKYATYGDRDIDPPDDLLDWKEFTLANLASRVLLNLISLTILVTTGE